MTDSRSREIQLLKEEMETLKNDQMEIVRQLQAALKQMAEPAPVCDKKVCSCCPLTDCKQIWTLSDHKLFVQHLAAHGNGAYDQANIPNKTTAQVEAHVKLYFQRVRKLLGEANPRLPPDELRAERIRILLKLCVPERLHEEVIASLDK